MAKLTDDQIDGLLHYFQAVLDACDKGRMRPAPGCGVGGMTIEANIRGSAIYGVPAWPVEEARSFFLENGFAGLSALKEQETGE